MKRSLTFATILTTLSLAGATLATADDKKEKPQPAAKKEAASKPASPDKATAAKKAAAEKVVAAKKKPANKKPESKADKKKPSPNSYEAQRKAAYEKYLTTRKALSEKRAKASEAHQKAVGAARITERALADIESALKRNEYEWNMKEKTYQSWKEREASRQRERAKLEAANRQRSENAALKQAVYDLKKELDSLKRHVASLHAEDKPARPSKDKKPEKK